MKTLLTILFLVWATALFAADATISFSDQSANEDGFRVLTADETMSLYTDPFLEFRRSPLLAFHKPSAGAAVKMRHRVTAQ